MRTRNVNERVTHHVWYHAAAGDKRRHFDA